MINVESENSQEEINHIRAVRQGLWMQLMQDPEETLKLLERLGFDGEGLSKELILSMMMKELAGKGLESIERQGEHLGSEELTFLEGLL